MKIAPPELTNGTITLRPFRDADERPVYEAVIESRADMWPWLAFAHRDYNISETRQWLHGRRRDWEKGVSLDMGIFGAADGSFIGGCGMNRIDWFGRSGNLGYWVRTGRIGHGIAPAAARLLADWVFRELRFVRIEILIAVGNERSMRVAEKLGALREGTLRNRIFLEDQPADAVMFSLIPTGD